uniref:Uncharacterized protein n=1 Tax=Timema shepardi TaxID=629360 RepID=A0A7R9B188_TIMSH|nr:unnamed protein product [Timema shepardi]
MFQELRNEVQNAPGKLHPIKCDITSEEDILAAFEWTKEHLNGVDILVNNAGVGTIQTLIENTTSELRKILDVNVLGLSICTREAVKSMRERGVDDGHIIHINRNVSSGLVVIGSGYGPRGPGFDSRCVQIIWEAVGLERARFSLGWINKELLD